MLAQSCKINNIIIIYSTLSCKIEYVSCKSCKTNPCFLQDIYLILQDLTLYLARHIINLARQCANYLQDLACRILPARFSLQDLASKILLQGFLAINITSCKSNLARKVQDLYESCKKSFIFSARLASFARFMQDTLVILASLAR